MERTTYYRGAYGYNESPGELGGSGGFWAFPDYEALTYAYANSSSLDEVLQQLGVPTYSTVISVIDQQGYAMFELLALSTRNDLYMRQYDLMELAVAWLNTRGHQDLDAAQLGVAGVTREMLENMKRDHETHLERRSVLDQRRQSYVRELRFIYGYDTEDEYAANAPADDENE
jgi:hypothetical protein